MIVVVDYGMGNLRSVQKGLEKVGQAATVTGDPAAVADADAIVLPGVGALGDCYAGLESRGLIEPVLAAIGDGRPFLGICVGLQLLFEEGEEGGGAPGLGVFPGRVVRFPSAKDTGLKVPHMGWNQVVSVEGRHNPLLPQTERPYMYFVHSYYAQPSDPALVLATCRHGVDFAAIVGRDNVLAVQFHPEKSQTDGLKVLKAFGAFAGGGTRD